MATQQRCPKCNRLNELNVAQCAYCAAPLTQTCPRCGTTRAWYVTRCPRCDVIAADESNFTSLFREAPRHRLDGRYEIRETLATSRVSAVYRAVYSGDAVSHVADPSEAHLGVAIKELSTVALFRAEEKRAAEQAFKGAVQRWSAVQHPALVRILDSFTEHGKYYVVLDCVPGWSLRKVIEENRVRVTPELARNWGAQLAGLGAYLHSQTPPLYFPFLSPNHVMVTADGQVKLIDLGFTHIFSPNSYGPYGSIHGYAAPELELGSPSVTTDIFSLGRLLYAILTGYLLEKGFPRQMTLRQAVPGISAQLVRVVAKAANRAPEARYSSMAEFGHALWDEMEGPLEPIKGWLQLPNMAPHRPKPGLARRVTLGVADGAQESMTELGFQRDARFGPEITEPVVAQEITTAAQVQALAKLSVYPRTFSISDLKPGETRRLVLVLRNAGSTDIAARTVSHVSWLSAPSKVIALPPGKQARVLLSLRADAIAAGRTVEPQALSVESGAGRQWVGVQIDIPTGPSLQIGEAAYDLGSVTGDGEQTWYFALANAGRQTLTAHVSSRVPWLRVSPSEVRCAAQGSMRVPVTLVPSRLPRGEQRVPSALVVDSDGGQAQIEVRAWRQQPQLDLGATHMDLGAARAGEIAERYLYIHNAGDGLLEGNARPLVPWLQVQPQQFNCPPQEMVQLTIVADTVGLPDGPIEVPQALRIQSNGGNQTLSLRLEVHAPKLVLSVSQLRFGTVPFGEVRALRLVVRNEGSAPIDCTLQSMVPWLQLSECVIHGEADSATEVLVRANTSLFQQGQQIEVPSAVRIVCGAQVLDLPASITVLRPVLRVEPEQVDFGYIDRSQPETRQLTITNCGTGRLAWNVQSDVVWAEITPPSGFCEAGESSSITLVAYGLALEEDSASGVVVINSDGGRTKIPLRIALAAPILASDTTLLDLGTSENLASVSGSFRIFNHGMGSLRGSISPDRTWLVVDRASFEAATGRSVEVRVSTDMEEFTGQNSSSGHLLVTSNGGEIEIEVTFGVVLTAVVQASSPVVLLRRSGTEIAEGRIVLNNVGMAAGHVELEASHAQLRLSRSVCDIKPGKSVRVGVEWDASDPDAEGRLYVDVFCGTQHLRLPVEAKDDRLGTPTLVPQTQKESSQ